MAAAQNQASQPRSLTLIERSFRTLNLTSGPTALRDGEYLELENLMPYGEGHLTVFPGQALSLTAPPGKTISAIWGIVIASTPYIVAQTTDGAVYAAVPGTSFTMIAAAGSTTVNGLHIDKWQATDAQGNPEAMLWVDTVKGYGSWTGSTWNVLASGQTGQCLAVYAGRVWIGAGQEIVYTAPDTYNDFNAADYAGAFKVTDPSMNGPVIALRATQNWLYIIGSGMVALNNVQVQNVAGSSALSTTFFIAPVSSSVGITTDRASLVLDNILFSVTNTGLWAYRGLNGQNIATNMGDNFDGSQFLFASQVYARNILTTSAGYNLMVDSGQWFPTVTDSLSWISGATIVWEGLSGWVTNGSHVYQFGSDFTTVRTCILHGKLYDCGNGAANKRAINAGFELFQDGLLPSPPTGRSVSGSWNLVGYKAASPSQSFGKLDVTQNHWVHGAVSMTDRYLGVELNLSAPPSCAVGALMIQFQESTEWP